MIFTCRQFAPRRILPVALLLALALSACTIQLAPDYDASVVSSLNKANTDAQTLFASISYGVPASSFDKREQQYNNVIGEFSALVSQLEARPMPQPPSFFSKALPPNDVKEINLLTAAPSIDALKHLVGTLTMMRDTDRKMGLPPSTPQACVQGAGAGMPTACLFENSYKADFNDALTYETALQR